MALILGWKDTAVLQLFRPYVLLLLLKLIAGMSDLVFGFVHRNSTKVDKLSYNNA